MYDVEKLVSIVCDALDAEADAKRYNREMRTARELAVTATVWIPSLDGSTAYSLGASAERARQSYAALSDICAMLDVDCKLLVAAVKSMQRWERHGGRWDRPCLTCWMGSENKERLARFIKNPDGWIYHYESTGRKKAWCQ